MKVALVVLAILGTAFAADHGKGLRIINGWEVPPHSIPYQAYIVSHGNNGESWFCSGTLITQHFVLTAAHCLTGAQHVRVLLGAHDLRVTEPGSVEIGSRNIIIHEQYNQLYFDNDIALVELDGRVAPSETINFVRLPQRDSPPLDHEGSVGTVSGWGLEENFQASPVLRASEDVVIPNQACWDAYQNVNEGEMCLGATSFGSPCRGDSGGPLIINNLQEGIFSYGQPDCAPQWPAVFERIRPHMEWIQTHSDHRD